jgi:glycosyltransferase involved in cell wall biosynthesis
VLTGKETFAWTAPGVAHAHGVPVVQRLAGTVTYSLLEGKYPEALTQELRTKLAAIECLVTPSRYLAATVPRLGLGRVVVVPTSIDLDRFVPGPRDVDLATRHAIAADDLVVAHVSNLKSVKRPLDVVESAALALQEHRRLVYLIVGDGALRPQLERAAQDLGIADRVRFAGWRPYEEMPAYVRLADLVVMPSTSEALARAYVETQASGRVLVASDIPAAREVVEDGETGLLFPRADARMLATVTLRAAHDPALRAHIGRHARRRAERHSIVDAVDAYEGILHDVARARPHRAGDA